MKQLFDYDGMALGELVRKKEVKPTELLEITIRRIEKMNPKLNAVNHKMYDQGWEEASLFSLAAQLEQVRPGNNGNPFIHCSSL